MQIGNDIHNTGDLSHFTYRKHFIVFGGTENHVKILDQSQRQKFGHDFVSIEEAVRAMDRYFDTMLSENSFA